MCVEGYGVVIWFVVVGLIVIEVDRWFDRCFCGIIILIGYWGIFVVDVGWFVVGFIVGLVVWWLVYKGWGFCWFDVGDGGFGVELFSDVFWMVGIGYCGDCCGVVFVILLRVFVWVGWWFCGYLGLSGVDWWCWFVFFWIDSDY